MLEISGIAVVTAFLAGLVSFLSPCVLPLVPGYISYVGGESIKEMKSPGFSERKLAVLMLSLCFIFGFSTVFIALGASATVIGQLLSAYQYEANILGGIIVVLFGLFMTGIFQWVGLQREFRFHGDMTGGRPLGAYILGLAFAFGWTPCIGPILGSILMVSATSSLIGDGTALLAIYSMGLGLPFIVAALCTDRFLNYSRRIRRYGPALQVGAGIVLIAMGVAMIFGYLSDFAWWMLKVFPWLGNIG